MIDRYLSSEIKDIWSDETKYAVWHIIEDSVIQSMEQIAGSTPIGIENPKYDAGKVNDIKVIENWAKHDVASFVIYLSGKFQKKSHMMHVSLTSSDLVDTWLMFCIKRSVVLVESYVDALLEELKRKEHKASYLDISIIGRTHGQQASPMKLSHKIGMWIEQLTYFKEELHRSANILCIKAEGPVGEGTVLSKNIHQRVGLSNTLYLSETTPKCSQVMPRCYFTPILSNLLNISMILNSMAVDLRLMAQTEIGEFTEKKTNTQIGSSSMPHKCNTINLEKICGLSRVASGYFSSLMGNISLWSERDISNSCVERIVWPDLFHTIIHQLKVMASVIDQGRFNFRRMRDNLMNASIGILSYYIMNGYMIYDGMPYMNARAKTNEFLRNMHGVKIKDISHDTIKDRVEFKRIRDVIERITK